MSADIKIERLEALRLMILELAKGNFAHRILLQNHHDDIQGFEIMLNLLAEELGAFFVYSHSFKERNISEPFVFVMDSSFIIRGFNKHFLDLLGYSEDQLLGQCISKLMKKEAQHRLQQEINHHIQAHTLHSSIKTLLCFHTFQEDCLECWGYCHWLWDGEKPYFFFRGLPIKYSRPTLKSPIALEPTSSYATLQLQSDIQSIRKVHQFILENLHRRLPTLPTIARKFNLNEFKLKTGFKELYQTTIFKFHLHQRLDLALVMIKFTPTSLKVVATSHGFKSLAHFSRAFKKKFGKSPSHFKQQR